MHLILGLILIVCIGIFILCWGIYNEIKKLVKAIKNNDQKILKNQREIKNELRYHNIINDKEPIAIANEYYSETSEVNNTKDFIRGALSKGVMGMHKKKFTVAIIVALSIMCSCGVTKNREVEAMPDINLGVAATLFVDGSDMKIPGYSIDQRNYYHLRSLAIAMMNTTGRFKISDVETDYIKLETGYNYTDTVETFYAPTITAEDIKESTRAVYINDVLVNVSSYIIDGDTYVRLRDLSEEMGYKINYVPENNKVWVSTSDSICSYIRDVVYNPKFTYYPFTNIGLNIEDINKILSHSYISGCGQYFYDLQSKYGLNVVYAIAVAYVESGRGKYPCAKNNYFGMLGCNYSSPAAGIDAFGALMMKKLYYGKTIDQIAPIYCDNQWAGLIKKMMSEIWSYRV